MLFRSNREDIPLADDPSKVRAEIRARQAEDGRKAMAEYEANAAAVRAKTERLRALRLAREAELAANPPAKPAKAAAAKAGKTAKTKKAPAKKLSDWLDGERDSGRST